MNAPEIVYRLYKFNFNVALDIGEIPSRGNAANHITPLVIRKDNLLSGRQGIRNAEDSAVVKNDDGPALLPGRAGSLNGVAILTRQTSDGDRNFKANRIGSRRLTGRILRGLRRWDGLG